MLDEQLRAGIAELLPVLESLATQGQAGAIELADIATSLRRLRVAEHIRLRRTHPGAWSDRTRAKRARRAFRAACRRERFDLNDERKWNRKKRRTIERGAVETLAILFYDVEPLPCEPTSVLRARVEAVRCEGRGATVEVPP